MTVTVAATVAGLLVPVLGASHASRAAAAPPAGTGGMFQALQGRLVDTRYGIGGYSTPQPAGSRTYQVEGQVGIPASGVSAVAISVTVLNPAAGGYISVTPDPVPPGSGTSTVLTWAAGQTTTSSTLVGVGSDGKINVTAQTATDLLIDVQGYFNSGNGSPAPGGYVPVAPANIVNTVTGVGAPKAKIAHGATLTVQGTGVAGVPSGAAALAVDVAVLDQGGDGYITVYPGGTRPTTSENFTGTMPASFGMQAALNSSGQFVIYNGAATSIDIQVNVTGYFTASNGSAAFNPWQTRVLDTRSPSAPLAAGSVTTVQVAGLNGVPAPPTGVAAVALTFQAIESSSGSGGYLRAWAADQSEPTSTSVINMVPGQTRSNLAVVAVDSSGDIKVRNGASIAVNLVLDVQGWYATSTAWPQASGPNCAASGQRSGSRSITHALTDRSQLLLNPVNGNLNLTGTLLHLKGVGQDVTVSWRYNGLNDTRPTLSTGLFETALQPWSDGSFTYVAPDGGCYKFTKSGITWPVPAGINATLTSSGSTTMNLRFNPGGITNTYTLVAGVWQLSKSTDASSATIPNTVSYTYSGNLLSSITDTQGRQITFAYTDPNNPSQPSSITDTSLGRTINLVYGGPSGALSSITDATGAVTSFGYDTTGLTSITDGAGRKTTFGYDSQSRLTSWTFGAGTSSAAAWSAGYPSSTSTTITDPNNHAATYTLSGSTVTSVTDALGHHTDSSWDPHDNLLKYTDNAGDATQFTYGNGTGNPNNMLSKITSPAGSGTGTGASISLTYPSTSTGTLVDYQPTASTDAQNNVTNLTWDPNTNQLASYSTTDSGGHAVGGTHSATYQDDKPGTNCGAKPGEMCSSTTGNGNTTTYGYDSSGNLTSITPPAPLGPRSYSYDAAGRVTSASDGRGNTAYYSYDNDDRITQISYTATGCDPATCVTYGYDKSGNKTSRTDASGTTSWGYDPLNRMTSKSLGSDTTSATYDGADNMTSYTDAGGTVTYGYDAANKLITLAEPGGSCPAGVITPNSTLCTIFGYDNDDRRTSISFATGQITSTSYDDASRVTDITAKTSGGTILAERSYHYQSSGGTDQSVLATLTDQSGNTTSYYYDGLNRLTSTTGTDAGSWTYDNDGNRTSSTTSGGSTYAAYNAADELCWTATTSGSSCTSPPAGATSYTSDTTGNQTSDQTGQGALTNTINVFNQLISTAVSGNGAQNNTYADATNTERVTASGTTFTNGILGITRQNNGSSAVEFIRDPTGTLIAMRTPTSYYYTLDALGSVIAITDSNQNLAASYHWDPWGTPPYTGGPGTIATLNPWRFAGGYYDTQTGYYKFGARYYNPTTGRFTQPDPNTTWGNYTYANNDPVNNSDVTGRDWSADLLAGVAGAAVGVALLATGVGAPVAGAAAGFTVGFVGTAANTYESNGSPNWGEALFNGVIGGLVGGILGL